MSGAALKSAGIQQTAEHHPLALETALREIQITRNCRLRTKNHDEVFTIEELVEDIRSRCKYSIPHNLNGAIGNHARKRELVEDTGRYVKASRDSRHDNKVAECRWALY